MVTSTKSNDTTSTAPTSFELPSVEEATQQVRDLNVRMIESSRSTALAALDAFEKALQTVGEMELKAASATQLDWVSAAAASHTKFMTDVSAPYTKAVRDLLN